MFFVSCFPIKNILPPNPDFVRKSQDDLDNSDFLFATFPTMATNTLTIITIALGLICLYFLAREWNRQEKQITDLAKRVRDLETANVQRLPYKSFEELLDAMAALNKEIEERKFQTSLIENAAGHIANAMKVGTKRETK